MANRIVDPSLPVIGSVDVGVDDPVLVELAAGAVAVADDDDDDWLARVEDLWLRGLMTVK